METDQRCFRFSCCEKTHAAKRAALLIACRVDDVEHHGQEKIANQNSERGVDDSFSCRAADAHRAFARGQAFVATNEHDEYSETECF